MWCVNLALGVRFFWVFALTRDKCSLIGVVLPHQFDYGGVTALKPVHRLLAVFLQCLGAGICHIWLPSMSLQLLGACSCCFGCDCGLLQAGVRMPTCTAAFQSQGLTMLVLCESV